MHVHVVFVTKHRRNVPTGDMLALRADAVRKMCAEFGAELVEFNGEDDHVHVLIGHPPTVQTSKAVNSLKGVSARKLRDEHRTWVDQHSMNGHLLSPSHFAASCGGAPISIVGHCIEQQQRPPRAPGRPKSVR